MAEEEAADGLRKSVLKENRFWVSFLEEPLPSSLHSSVDVCFMVIHHFGCHLWTDLHIQWKISESFIVFPPFIWCPHSLDSSK